MPHRALADGVADANVAVIIVNYRTPQLTMECLAALRGEKDLRPGLRVVVVDGGSGDGSAAELADGIAHPEYQGWVSLIPLAINGGFGWANNQAILTLASERNPPEFIHLLNPDTRVKGGAVSSLIEDLQEHPRCGAAGSQLIDAKGDPSASAFRFPSPGRELVSAARSDLLGRVLGIKSMVVNGDEALEVDWVTGASVMFRTDALRDCGLFDDGFFLYFDEVELMHRLHARGWTIRHVPESCVVHFEGSSTGIGASHVMPAYWYNSRRRYFTLTAGASSAVGAGLGLIAGRAFAALKGALKSQDVQGGVRMTDVLRNGFWPGRDDSEPSVPRMGDKPGRPPAWMRRQ